MTVTHKLFAQGGVRFLHVCNCQRPVGVTYGEAEAVVG